MTLVRRLALKISAFVVRFASAGCKQWAEGLLQETEHIENDWAALEWALGSMRVLLDRREAPFRSMTEAMAAAHRFIDTKRNLTDMPALLLLMPMQAINFGFRCFRAKYWLERVGCAEVFVMAVVCFVSVFIERRRLRAILDEDIEDEVRFYRSELQRSLEAPRKFFVDCSLVLWMSGMILSLHDHKTESWLSVVLVVLFVLGVPLVLRERRVSRRRLDQLNALLAQ
jgi:uncharacterized protein involved in response to NO